MARLSFWFAKRGVLAALAPLLLVAVAGAVLYFTRPATLIIAVAPRDGTEPGLIRAYADALDAEHATVRLKILPFDTVRESADALQDGRADLAVVRPDVMLPRNGLTLAILRDQAMIVVAPDAAGIKSFAKLAGKHLGIASHLDADVRLLRTILAYYDLALDDPGAAGAPAAASVRLVPLDDAEITQALRERRIDAFVSIIAPTAPRARAQVEAVRAASRTGKLDILDVPDSDAVIQRHPRLQAVTIPSGLFGGRPKLPEDDTKTVGASYRLMARASLSRVVAADLTQQLFALRTAAAEGTEAAEYVEAPSYETTVAATSASIPIHPGAIDYYEREQHGLIERYGDTLYLLAALLGGLASAFAWLRQRLARLRRERIDEITDRLVAIVQGGQAGASGADLDALAQEVDRLAVEAVHEMRARDPDVRTLTATRVAIDAARAALAERRATMASPTVELPQGRTLRLMPRDGEA